MQQDGPRILLSEGSSLSSRETITALGLAGYRVEVVSSDSWCLGRFSRYVSQIHRAPRSGLDPDGYLVAVASIIERRKIDALIPVHEQAYLFAAARERLPAMAGVALADFDAFEQVQSKAMFGALLSRLDVPQPETEIIASAADFAAGRPYPFFVKSAFGTASTGVWRVADRRQQDELMAQLAERGAFGHGIIVQAAVKGPLERTQAIFDHGRLVASHIYRQMVDGPGGGDVLKMSVNRPAVRAIIERIGGALAWHGALSFDYILEDGSAIPRFFDANPRLVEPMNAWFSGVDLAGALLQVTLGLGPPVQPEGREGVLTRLGLMGLLDAARRRGSRYDILREIGLLARDADRYRGSVEELTLLGKDPWSAIPLAMVVTRLLLSPSATTRLARGTVAAYSLTPDAIGRLRAWRAAVRQ